MAEGRHGRPDAAEARRDGMAAGDPGQFAHTPVMLGEVLAYLNPQPGEVILDCTLGGGGHAEAVLDAIAPGGRLVGLDRDPTACAVALARLEGRAARQRVDMHVVQSDFSELEERLDELGIDAVDGCLFDLGVSSHQLDNPERGFSFRDDAPLDMRMNPGQRTTAYHLVNGLSEDELADIIRRFGEERWARRIAQAIVRYRQQRGLLATTGELVGVVKAAIPVPDAGGAHPARRTFQALRIAVNNELGQLEAGLRAAVGRLRPGGRLVVISFHSLEDRIAKRVLRELAKGCTCPPDWPVCRCGRQPELRPLVQRPVQATAREAADNPRSRSAKLRAAKRLQADGPEPAEEERSAGGTGGAAMGPPHYRGLPSVAETLYPHARPVLHLGRGE